MALVRLLCVLCFSHCITATIVFVRPVAAGAADGTSWNNACAGRTTINLNNGGTVSQLVRVQGVDGNLNPAFATIIGSRAQWTLPSDPEKVTNASAFGGNKLFEVRANSFEFSHISFYHVGFVFAFNRNTTNVLLENIKAYNVRSFVDQDAAITITNITVRKVQGTGYSKKFVRFQGGSNNFLIEDVEANSGRQAYDNFAGGVTLDGNAFNGTVRNCYFSNGHDTHGNDTSKYWNSDGYSSERGNYDLLFDNCRSSGFTDGGHDHKSERVTFKNCLSWDNKRNYRLWGKTNWFYNSTSLEPRNRGGSGGQSHYFLAEKAQVIVYGGRVQHSSNKTTAFYLEANSTLTLVGMEEVYLNGSTLKEYKAQGARVIRQAAPSTTGSSVSNTGQTAQSGTTGESNDEVGPSDTAPSTQAQDENISAATLTSGAHAALLLGLWLVMM